MADKPSGPTRTATQDLVFFLGILGVLFVLWISNGGYKNKTADKVIVDSPVSESKNKNHAQLDDIKQSTASEPSQTGASTSDSKYSPWRGKIKIGYGNGRYEKEANKEYLTLYTALNSDEKVNITGWQLMNNDAGKPVVGSPSSFGTSRFSVIPTGTQIVLSNVSNKQEPIILKSGQTVYVYTGKSPNVFPASFNTSFRENKCLGYAADGLISQNNLSCPAPRYETGIDSLDQACYDFINNHSCRDDMLLYADNNKINLSGTCRDFVNSHFSYSGCILNHQNDTDFLGSRWFVYLEQSREMWSADREVITLLDVDGKVVDVLSLY